MHLSLENFECKKSLIKNYRVFLTNSIDTSKLFFRHLFLKHLRRQYQLKVHPDFDFKRRVENFLISENMHFLVIFQYLFMLI